MYHTLSCSRVLFCARSPGLIVRSTTGGAGIPSAMKAGQEMSGRLLWLTWYEVNCLPAEKDGGINGYLRSFPRMKLLWIDDARL